MKIVVGVIVLAAVAALALGSNVVTLTSENFESELASKPLMMVEFYAPWCGHCKRLEPEYEVAADGLEGVDAWLGKVDATEENELATKYGVRGYPTLIVFRDGEEAGKYEGAREAKAIEEYMVRQTLPAVTDLTAETAAEFAASADFVVIGTFAAGSDEAAVFESVASALRDSFLFGRVDSSESTGIMIYKNIDEDSFAYEGELDKAAISEYLLANSLPLFDEVGPSNYRSYVETGLPMGMVFVSVEDTESLDAMKAVFKPVAAEFAGQAVFVYVDTKYIQQAMKMGLSGDVVPSFAIEDMASGMHYAFDESAELTADAVLSFVGGVLGGEIAPTIKSEPIPESQDGPVTVVVADSFEDVVLDESKDVLMEFYAPWCGHCKSLAPTYDQLGEEFADVDSVVIAKMDATANDIPVQGIDVRGFPTLIFFPAGSGGVGAQIKYDGAREFDDLKEFVLAQATSLSGGEHEDL